MNRGWMPVALGEPPAILYWDIDEILPVLLACVAGIFVGNLLACLGLSAIYFYIMSKYKENLPKGFAVNILYMSGLLRLKNTPPYIASEFRE